MVLLKGVTRVSSIDLEKSPSGKLFLPALAVSNFATGPLGVLIGLLLIDIAVAFDVSVGVMGQVNTLSSVVAVFFSVLTGVLSVRFRHKSLLLIGLLCVSFSALGCFLATGYDFMLVAFSLSGVGTALVFPMVITLVGEHFHLGKRGNAIGWIIAAGSLSYLIGAPVTGFVSGVGGWRFVLLVFVIPVSIGSLFLALVSVPSGQRRPQPIKGREAYLRSFKVVLLNRSAVACLIGNVLRTASFVAIVLYGVSFFRQLFLVSSDFATGIILGAALCYTVGSLIGGRLVNRFGRRSLTVFSTLLAGIFIVSFVNVFSLWVSLVLNFVGTWFSGMASSVANSFSLEQVPESRGTMMSVNSAALNLGNAVGSAIGGFLLILFNYEIMGSVLGMMGILAAIIFHLLTRDPSQ